MTAGMRVLWRGEIVRVVSVRPSTGSGGAGAKAQIARPGVGLRWVRLAELVEVGR